MSCLTHKAPARMLTSVFGALILAVMTAVVMTGPAGAGVGAPAGTPAAPPVIRLATGDTMAVSQPTIPATCETLDATLETSNEQFSSGDESSPPDTTRIQDALNSCSGTGEAVVLAPDGSDNAFLSGPLSLPGDVDLVVYVGATLYASRNPANYQVSGQATCGTTASSGNGCKPFINVTGSDSGIMGTQNSNGSQGEIDGRGDQDILGTSTTWWALSNTAQSDNDDQNNPRLIESDGYDNLTVYDIDLVNAPLFHVYFQSGSGLTVWGVRIDTPASARNTDGVDPDSSSNVLVNDSYIQDGDDGIAIKTNASAASGITIENSHFYGTHGISIGSETQYGVSNVLVENDTISGSGSTSNNGIRIKTDSSVGGKVSDITYENICDTGVQDNIDFTPFYSSGNGSTTPDITGVTVDGFKSEDSASGAESVFDGYSSSYPLGLMLENVDLDATSSSAEYADIDTYDSNVTPSGTDVTVTGVSGSGSVPSCSFPAYPGL